MAVSNLHSDTNGDAKSGASAGASAQSKWVCAVCGDDLAAQPGFNSHVQSWQCARCTFLNMLSPDYSMPEWTWDREQLGAVPGDFSHYNKSNPITGSDADGKIKIKPSGMGERWHQIDSLTKRLSALASDDGDE